MRIDKWVKEYQRLILGIIVGVIGLSMLITFVPGTGLSDSDSANSAYGSFTYKLDPSDPGTKIDVDRARFSKVYTCAMQLMLLRNALYEISPKYFNGKLIFSQHTVRGNQDPLMRMTLMMQQYFGKAPVDFEFVDNPRDYAERITWETLILLEHADRMGLTVSDQQVADLIPQIYSRWQFTQSETPVDTYTKQSYVQWVQLVFPQSSPKQFEDAVGMALKIAKLLNLQTMTEFTSYRELYENGAKEAQKVRVRAAVVDPKSHAISAQLRPITLEEVGKFYKQNRHLMKSPPLARIAYVSASYRNFKNKAGDMSEKTLQEYYEANKGLFTEGEGEAKKQLSCEEAREKVEEKWLRSKLETDLYHLAWELKNEISDEMDAQAKKTGKALAIPEIEAIVDQKIKARNAKGEAFEFGLTDLFSRQQSGEVKRTLGSDTKVENFAFPGGASPAEGDIWNGVDKTEKGCYLYVMYKKIEPKELPLTRRMEEDIRKRLQDQQLAELGREYAKKVAKHVTEHGYRDAARNFGLTFALGGFFSAEGRGAGDEDPFPQDKDLSPQIPGTVKKLTSIGQATWAAFSRDRKPMFGVVMLDDRFVAPLDKSDDAIKDERARLNEERRLSLKERLRGEITRDAGLEEILKKNSSSQ